MLQNAPNCTIQNKILREACPEPHSKRLATPRVANRLAACNSPSPQKVGPHWQILHTPMYY